ncbi:adenylate/guanylate cyclase domain-containing protein [Mycobacterium sp. ITM-2016-00318]|uniref:adenylate/guanylate cyclase domain-containing protein n=1 Tax=Mycobacterium sp. ITM-2016-00318 TaxID=2099693 RepID=UPI000CFA1472|nr:adenylate/guanylate cyclase domain-containing protein [Mycobacterium sp. ITM-2016-00318]WNG93103.1 adenylate/guanylate cyclase domain-containing protein [Mycobacterium sp. ITM-2016-00318]
MPPPTRYARCGDLSIAYQVFGDGPHDLLIVPGYVWHIEQLWNEPGYHRMMRELTDFARVINYDKRGTGMSDPVPAAPSLDERMDDVLAVLDATGTERTTIFGISEGGPIGALFAATHPERTERLIIYGSFVCSLDRADGPGVERYADRWREIRADAEGRWGEGVNLAWAAPSIDTPTMRRAVGLWERLYMSPAMARANMKANFEIDIRPILSSISVPTLVLHRSGEAVPIEHGRYYADHIPGARIVELHGSDHWPFVGDVDAIVAEVEEFVTGVRGLPESETLLATVLFTDIVGSTERAASLGDATWRAVLEEHDEIVRRQLAAHGGREIKNLGDGFLAMFDRPARAVRSATNIASEAASLGISIRAGLHTGECEQRGDDVAGLAVHIGARIGALAAPDEVLVSGTVRDLVLGSGIDFADRGHHVLKGVPGEWHLFAVEGTSVPLPLADDRASSSLAERALYSTGRRAPAVGRAFNRIIRTSSRRKR